ncbi:AbrB/MazE/SpoVT family DNA-binding domain-containing protein [Candidatus Woesearchaeota archaeon]|nr:AbrB/MazE/SpoVT family DNA-binding domain-containing protein [Candidatus Woesearchaeota archaeon]
MKRKLVQQGAATMMISLPAKWIKANSLNKGSEINLEQHNNSLIISGDRINTKSETEIKILTNVESSIRTLITNTYRNGFDKIRVNFENEQQFKILKHIIKSRLTGFDIIKKENNYCIVENITEPTEDQFENILSKLLLNIEEFFEITKKRFENPKEIYDYEETSELIQKYDNFCRRIIIKYKYNNKKTELLWAFLTLIIHGQRELHHLNKVLNENIKISKETRELLVESENLFKLVKKAYLEKDINLLSKIHNLEKEIMYKKGYSLLSKVKNQETKIVYHIMVASREFYQANSPLSGLII